MSKEGHAAFEKAESGMGVGMPREVGNSSLCLFLLGLAFMSEVRNTVKPVLYIHSHRGSLCVMLVRKM